MSAGIGCQPEAQQTAEERNNRAQIRGGKSDGIVIVLIAFICYRGIIENSFCVHSPPSYFLGGGEGNSEDDGSATVSSRIPS